MSKHSPGPWHWAEVSVGDADGHHLKDSEGEPILMGGADDGSGWLNGIVEVDAESYDARLIAAAPELLQALRGWLTWDAGSTGGCGGRCAAYQEGVALIRRIEGES